MSMSELQYVLGLLDLACASDADTLLRDAVRLVSDRTGAGYGYIEVEAGSATTGERRVAHGYDPTGPGVSAVEVQVSRTIISAALAGGEPIGSTAAVDDRRSRQAGSARQAELNGVLCVPFGLRLCGVIYLQASAFDADFPSRAIVQVRLAARVLTRLLEPRRFYIGPRPTAREQANAERRELVRDAVAVHGRNLSEIEKATGISRTQLRRILARRDDDESYLQSSACRWPNSDRGESPRRCDSSFSDAKETQHAGSDSQRYSIEARVSGSLA